MCVAVPARVVERVSQDRALVEQGDSLREVSVLAVPDVAVGEYVLLNLGVAVEKLTEDEALAILDLWRQFSLSMTHDTD